MKQLAAHLYKTMPSVLPKNEAELLAVRQSDAVSNKRAKSNSSLGYDPTRAEITVQERHTHSHPPSHTHSQTMSIAGRAHTKLNTLTFGDREPGKTSITFI